MLWEAVSHHRDTVDSEGEAHVSINLDAPLPTEEAAARAEGPRKYHNDAALFNSVGEGGRAVMSQPHDASYYEKWREEKKQQAEAGVDPWKDFERRAKEAREKTVMGKLAKAFRRKEKGVLKEEHQGE